MVAQRSRQLLAVAAHERQLGVVQAQDLAFEQCAHGALALLGGRLGQGVDGHASTSMA